MDEFALRKTIADNLIYFRRRQGLTQAALAQTLNYSDKSVSKWERAEGMPDVTVLMTLAELYGITLNDLVKEHSEEEEIAESASDAQDASDAAETTTPQRRPLRTRVLVPILSIGLVWLTAVIVFFLTMVICPTFEYSELIFLYAVPASCIVATVFACLWWTHLARFLTVSGIIWSVALCLDITFRVPYIHLIFVVAGVLQALTVLWFIFTKK